MLKSTLEGSLEEKQINNTHKWMDVLPQRYGSLENSKTLREAFMIPLHSPQLACQCRGNILLLGMPALPSKHLLLLP